MEAVIAIYVLTFVAVVAVVVAVWGSFAEAARAKEERMDFERLATLRTEEIGPPIDRFIRRGRLFRLRLATALLPGAALLVTLIMTGVRNPWALALAPTVFAVVGSMIPLLYYQFLVRRRQDMFERDILELTLGVSSALRSGMALPQALEKVGEQMTGPMHEELAIVLREYRLGADLVTALDRLGRRMPCEDIRLLTGAVKLTTEAGGSLTAVLAEMAAMIRGRRELADKLKALTAEGRFEAIAMSCAPVAAFFVLYFQQPEMMRVLYTTSFGWLTLGFDAGLILAGYVTIKKIMSIEV